MPLPRFSGQQLLRKDINEKGSEGERERETAGVRGGGCWDEVGGRAPGLREPVSERDGAFCTPAV